MAHGKIKMIVTDVDGVWTDGTVSYGAGDMSHAIEIKRFNVRDGLAVKLAQESAIQVVVVTGRSSEAVEMRCKELDIDLLRQGVSDKLAAVKEILADANLTFEQICYIGDDLPDLPVINNAAVSAAPSDAASEVLEAVRWRLDAKGGQGAFREVVERLLKKRGEWDAIVKNFHGAQITIQST